VKTAKIDSAVSVHSAVHFLHIVGGTLVLFNALKLCRVSVVCIIQALKAMHRHGYVPVPVQVL